MASETIGNLYPTEIPGYADSADIQAAFRLYHYGSLEYDIENTNTASLVNPSIAYSLNDLQTQITNLDPSGGVSKSIIDAKGDLIVGLAADSVSRLPIGSNNFILVADSASTLGMKWAAPEVTLTNSVTLSNKTLTSPKFADLGFIADANGNELIVMDTVTSAVNEIKVANAPTGNSPSISAQGNDTNVSLNLTSKGSGTVQANGSLIMTEDNNLLILAGAL